MSYTDSVANFVGSLEAFYESVPAEDLELLVGPVLERLRSQPGSPLSGSPIGKKKNDTQHDTLHIPFVLLIPSILIKSKQIPR